MLHLRLGNAAARAGWKAALARSVISRIPARIVDRSVTDQYG
jgi:hypothetical protein